MLVYNQSMAIPRTIKHYTPEEYYALERAADYKSDYYQGEIFSMAGGTALHSLISSNVAGEVRQLLKGKPCRVYESNLRMAVLATGLRSYPDVGVYCGPLVFDPADTSGETAVNPSVLFEVLSKSTEAYDRGLKAENYRRVETIQAYVLVSQDAPHVEIYERQTGGNWLLREVNTLEAVLSIPALGIALPLAEIYAGVGFPPPPEAGEDRVA
jgi:Uma2 family endonuclease